jgi:glycosyltransferase involved in cell wall biosynthesis
MSFPEGPKSISVLIPTLNEQEGIKKTLNAIPKEKLADLGYDLEIIIIDGNSTDLTREIAQTMGSKVILEKRKGYGRAYKTGFREAKGNILVTLDADGTYPADLIPSYVQHLKEKKLDFITVNRFSRMEGGAMGITHRVGNSLLSFFMQLLYSIDVKDSQSGMWVMSKKFADTINTQSEGFSLSEEIKIIAFKFFRAQELEGTYYRRCGKVKLGTLKDGWLNLKFLFKYKSLIKNALSPLSEPLEKEVTS